MTDEQVQGYNTIRYHIVKNLTDLLVIVLDHDSFGMVTWKHTKPIYLCTWNHMGEDHIVKSVTSL